MNQQPTFTPEKPTHRLFVVTGEGETANWKEIGAAWTHRDGRGHSINCTAFPLQGRLVMRAVTDKKPKPKAKAA